MPAHSARSNHPIKPDVLGDDEGLNHLAQAFFGGDYVACDDLYLNSSPQSPYESYGITCGGGNEPQGSCLDLCSIFSTDTSPRSGDLEGTPSGVLADARTGLQKGFDRFVLEFEEGGLPAYAVEYLVEMPGQLVLGGEFFLSVIVNPAGATGELTDLLTPIDTGNIVEAVLLTETLTMTWILGVAQRNGFEVFTPTDSPPLIVDVSHR